MDNLGLFPLGLVLFPDSSLPLHIFEPRYRELINNCIRQQTAFGINLIESSKFCEVGCAAIVSDVLEKYPDGRLDIVVTGKKRYRLERFTDEKQSYFTGEVAYFDDETEPVRYELLVECTGYYNRVVRAVFEKAAVDVSDVAAKRYPSYFLAEKAGLTVTQKQFLLETRSENHRLQTLLLHLRRTLPHVREAERVRSIIESDGYLPGTLNKH